MNHFFRSLVRPALAVLSLGVLAACASPEPQGPPAREFLWLLSADHQLLRVNAGQPGRVLERRPLVGLPAGEALVGIDYRVARGVMYALSASGRLYTVNPTTGTLSPVGAAPSAVALRGSAFGFDFNPAADRIRVVSDAGQNLRLHPDTGAAVDGDPNTPGVQGDPDLSYAEGDAKAGQKPQIVAAGYTYNTRDDKLTTNFAIDRASGTLVLQGTREGAQPAVSPNLGRLFTVGELGTGPLRDAAFDISDARNVALAALNTTGDARTRLYRVDLQSGRATLVGTLADGAAIRGLAIEP